MKTVGYQRIVIGRDVLQKSLLSQAFSSQL